MDTQKEESKKFSITSEQPTFYRELGSYELGTLSISTMLDSLIENRARVEGRFLSAEEVKEFYNALGVTLDPLSAGHIATRTNAKIAQDKKNGKYVPSSTEGLADRILEQMHPNAKGLKLGAKAPSSIPKQPKMTVTLPPKPPKHHPSTTQVPPKLRPGESASMSSTSSSSFSLRCGWTSTSETGVTTPSPR